MLRIKQLSVKTLFFLTSLLLAQTANAGIIVDLIGDKDGFGIGVQDGEGFSYSDVGPGDGDGTDVWRNGDYIFSHTFDLTSFGSIVDATLEIFTGGQGLNGQSTVYLDGVNVGLLTDGDNTGPEYNYATLDIFQLTDFAALLDNAAEIRIDTVSSGDGWVLDYSELTIYTADAEVPAPASVLLLGLAALGFVGYRRK
ncbi:PEP-CTERM sorting domain-containing protein [Corallincola holothuriorum]|uniref:PEP-CTERM sorting domain-containing protein n=1 Tax=Corallincola holothuriorum TaxID=2282215 RepID=A0A368N5E0_9GAMM|nr:PEP-CTERM sorting domain-containing protein [Corallincola holothuriorum]RCU45758.1 PEP-CTERM sorting domain-containing protein [Corallincola holothuriorum]